MFDRSQRMDREALESLVKFHQAGIYRYARYLGADPVASEDIVQETFLAAFKSFGKAKGTGEADVEGQAAWLRGIARNMFLRHCRRTKTGPVLVDAGLLEQAEGAWRGEFLRGGDGFDYVDALRRCVGNLSPEHQAMIEQRYAQDKSRGEMARRAGMTENGVKGLLRRIRAALADCIRRRLKMEEA